MTPFLARLRRLPEHTLSALAFFSRLPVRAPTGSFDLRQTAGAWPLAGLLTAAAPAALFWMLAGLDFPNLLASLIALAALAGLTGALHEDGLADVADGFGGGKTIVDKLMIMRDSRIGTYGVLALLFAVSIKVSALSAIGLRPAEGALALLIAATMSRAIALWHWARTSSARMDGLARAAGRPDRPALIIGAATGLTALVVALVVLGSSALVAIGLAGVAVALFDRLCRNQIGGHTGDTIGAAQQIAEVMLLIGFASGWDPVVWAPI